MQYVLLLLGAMFATRCAATSLYIDSFLDERAVVTTPGSTGRRAVYATHQVPEAAGGVRELIVRRESGTGTVSSDIGLNTPGAFNYASGAFARGSAVVIWDGPGTSTRTLAELEAGLPKRFGLDVDVTDRGFNSGLAFRAYSDLGVDLTLRFYHSSAAYITAVVSIPRGYDPTEEALFADFFVPFSDFTVTGELSPAAVLEDTRAITMLVAGRQGADAAITDLRTISSEENVRRHMPEPVGTGFIGLLMLTAAHFIRYRATGA